MRFLNKEFRWVPTERETRETFEPTGPRDPRWVQAAAEGFKRSGAERVDFRMSEEGRRNIARGAARSWMPGGKRYEAWQERQAKPESSRLCSVEGCRGKHHARGYCLKCYLRQPQIRDHYRGKMRERRKDPAFRARQAAKMREYRRDPQVRRRYAARRRKGPGWASARSATLKNSARNSLRSSSSSQVS